MSRLKNEDRETYLQRERDRARKYYQEHKETLAIRYRAYQAAHADTYRARAKAWYEANPERALAWRSENRLSLLGESITIGKLPPGPRELAYELKRARKAIREAQKGTRP